MGNSRLTDQEINIYHLEIYYYRDCTAKAGRYVYLIFQPLLLYYSTYSVNNALVAPLKIMCSYEAGDTFTVEFFSLPHTTSGVRFFG